jgi:PAS domain S-box-containing protein
MTEKIRILIVEDEALVAEDLKEKLQKFGYEVPGIAETGENAIALTEEHHPNLVLMDIHLAGAMDGITTGGEIRSRWGIPIIYVTAFATQVIIDQAKKTTPVGYILKPFNERQIQTAIEIALYNAAIERQLKERDETIKTLLNAIPDDLVLINSDKKIIAINESLAKKLGQNHEALTGRAIGDFLTSPVLSDTLDRIITSPMTGRQMYFEEKWNDRWFETMVYPISDKTGTDMRIVIQSHDITQRKQFEEELKNEGLSQIGQNMEQFQILNDQIRNPLQAISGYLELDPVKYRDAINSQVTIINNLVTQLDTGWLESEKVQQFLIRHHPVYTKSPEGQHQRGGLQ